MTSRSAAEVLDRDFLEIRARILEVAAALDRLDRAAGSVSNDARSQKLREAVKLLLSSDASRAEQVQLLFSLGYDADWRKTLGV